MEDIEVLIGKRIRKRRQSLKLTLQTLADTVGISKAMLSKIELGQVSTPISTYSRIAKSLEMSLVSLIGEKESEFLLIRKDDKKPLSSRSTSAGYLYEMLGDGWPNKLWSAYIITYDPETANEEPHFIHDSDEFFFVLEGQMQFHYQNKSYILSPGDCVFLDGRQSHGGQAYGGGVCKALMILTPKE